MLPSPRPASEPLPSSSPIIESLSSSSERPSERALYEESSKPRTSSTIDIARAPPRTTSQPPGFGLALGFGLAAGFGSDGAGLGAGLGAGGGVGFGAGFGAGAGLDAGFGWGFGWGGGRCRCTPGLSNSTL